MIPQACITEWRSQAPWGLDEQVEQDLVLSRAVVEIFSDPLLAESLAWRGGTALHKLYFEDPARYSEDIDLVQVESGPIGPAMSAIRTSAISSPSPATAEEASSKYHEWIAFDEGRAEELRDEGRLVFIDFTADWCFTCKTIERTVIETSAVADAFEKHEVVTMKADWTNPDERIAAFLKRYGRSAVPFYLLYRPDAEPHVFGELLTQGQILQVLGDAG